MAYVPRGGPVPVHPWLLIFRFLQLVFAILVIATTAYALSVAGGGPIQPPLIATLIIAVLTVLPILLFTTPLHISQRRLYDPRIALVLDLIAVLFWLASFAALASYLDIFSEYGRRVEVVDVVLDVCVRCRRAWRSGIAACVFAAVEFLLFLFTTLAFIYYYHCHLAGEPAYGISSSRKAEGAHNTAYAGTAGAAAEEHHLQENPTHRGTDTDRHSPMSDNVALNQGSNAATSNHGTTSAPNAPAASNYGGLGPVSNHGTASEGNYNPPYPSSPTRPPRPGGYGEFGSEGNRGYGADTTRP